MGRLVHLRSTLNTVNIIYNAIFNFLFLAPEQAIAQSPINPAFFCWRTLPSTRSRSSYPNSQDGKGGSPPPQVEMDTSLRNMVQASAFSAANLFGFNPRSIRVNPRLICLSLPPSPFPLPQGFATRYLRNR